MRPLSIEREGRRNARSGVMDEKMRRRGVRGQRSENKGDKDYSQRERAAGPEYVEYWSHARREKRERKAGRLKTGGGEGVTLVHRPCHQKATQTWKEGKDKSPKSEGD